jgi:stage V sporulation protein B
MERIRSGYSRTLRLLVLVALPVAAAGLALGPELLTILFGPSFRHSGVPLRILLLPFPLIPLMNVTYSLIVGLGKMKFPLVAGVASAIINVTLDFILIPRYQVNGAAIANATAQGVTAVVILLYGVRLAKEVHWAAASVLRMLLASSAAGLAAWAVLRAVGRGAPGLILGGCAGLAVFGTSVSLLRVLPREDGRWLRDEFGSVLGGSLGRVIRHLESG